MDKEKLDRIIMLVGALILLSLATRNIVISNQLDCNNCKVDLMSKQAGGEMYLFGTFWIPALYNEYYENGTCAIIWSPTQGYQYA